MEQELQRQDEEQEERNNEDKVHEIRIIYHSGAYVQAWFKTFSIELSENNQIVEITYEQAEPHISAKGKIIEPMFINPTRVESVWTIQSMSSDRFYEETAGKV